MTNRSSGPGGFSLIEVVVAIVIIAVGVLALAGTNGLMSTLVRVAGERTERMTVVQQEIERLRAMPIDQIPASSTPRTVGSYRVWWRATWPTSNLVTVTLYTAGRGYVPGRGWLQDVQDSLTTSIARR